MNLMTDYDTEDEDIILNDINTKKEFANCMVKMGEYTEAIKIYSMLLEKNKNNHIILSNRSVAYIKTEQYDLALDDCIKTTRLEPEWAKGWGRLGAVLFKQNKKDKAKVAYEKAYDLEKNDIYKDMILFLKIDEQSFDMPEISSNMFDKMFNSIIKNPNIMEKIINPKFQTKLFAMQSNPIEAFKDNDIMDVMNQMMNNFTK